MATAKSTVSKSTATGDQRKKAYPPEKAEEEERSGSGASEFGEQTNTTEANEDVGSHLCSVCELSVEDNGGGILRNGDLLTNRGLTEVQWTTEVGTPQTVRSYVRLWGNLTQP